MTEVTGERFMYALHNMKPFFVFMIVKLGTVLGIPEMLASAASQSHTGDPEDLV